MASTFITMLEAAIKSAQDSKISPKTKGVWKDYGYVIKGWTQLTDMLVDAKAAFSEENEAELENLLAHALRGFLGLLEFTNQRSQLKVKFHTVLEFYDNRAARQISTLVERNRALTEENQSLRDRAGEHEATIEALRGRVEAYEAVVGEHRGRSEGLQRLVDHWKHQVETLEDANQSYVDVNLALEIGVAGLRRIIGSMKTLTIELDQDTDEVLPDRVKFFKNCMLKELSKVPEPEIPQQSAPASAGSASGQ